MIVKPSALFAALMIGGTTLASSAAALSPSTLQQNTEPQPTALESDNLVAGPILFPEVEEIFGRRRRRRRFGRRSRFERFYLRNCRYRYSVEECYRRYRSGRRRRRVRRRRVRDRFDDRFYDYGRHGGDDDD